MGKKESPNTKDSPDFEALTRPKKTDVSPQGFAIIKFLLAVCLLPFVYSSSTAFLNELSKLNSAVQRVFWQGIVSFLLLYLFVWEPVNIYAKGQRILELVFSFFKPLVRVAPYLLPIYTLLLWFLYSLASLLDRSGRLLMPFLFLLGFSISLHLVLSARVLRTKKGDFLKGNYIFGFSFLYLLNVFLIAFILNAVFDAFSFVNFTNAAYEGARNIFVTLLSQLFVS